MPTGRFQTTSLALLLACAMPVLVPVSDASAQEAAAPAPARFDLSFPGGTVGEYVAAVRRALPGADVVVADEVASNVRLPAAQLTQVDLLAAMRLLDSAPVADGSDITVERIAHADGADAIYRVQVNTEFRRGPETHIWSVARPLAKNISAQAVLSAVEAALEVSGVEATVRFHPDTALLIVKAPSSALGVIEMALNEMTSSAEQIQLDQRRNADEIDTLEYQLAEAEGEARIAGEEMRLAGLELAWLEEAPAGEDERERIVQKSMAQMAVIRAETRLDLARRRADLVRSAINRLKGETGG